MSADDINPTAGNGALASWFNTIPDAYKIVIVFVTVFSAGLIAGVSLINWYDLPNVVSENTRQLQRQQERIAELEAQQEKWKPMIEELPNMLSNMRDLEREIKQSNCLTIAERENKPWRDCLDVGTD